MWGLVKFRASLQRWSELCQGSSDTYLGVPQNEEYHLGGPSKKDYKLWSFWEVPLILGKFHFRKSWKRVPSGAPFDYMQPTEGP